MALKDEWINKLVKDKTFVDVGGLWGTKNERVSVAIKAGSKKATMIDIQPMGHDLWTKFDERCASLGCSDYDSIQANVIDENELQNLPSFDVVHCSGILYHLPDPMVLINHLKSITNEYLILGSTTIPRKITVGHEVLETNGATTYFIPAFNADQKEFFSKHFNQEEVKVLGVNLGEDIKWYTDNKPNFAPWWWLFTDEYIVNLLRIAGLEVIEQYESWTNKSHTFLCKKIEA